MSMQPWLPHPISVSVQWGCQQIQWSSGRVWKQRRSLCSHQHQRSSVECIANHLWAILKCGCSRQLNKVPCKQDWLLFVEFLSAFVKQSCWNCHQPCSSTELMMRWRILNMILIPALHFIQHSRLASSFILRIELLSGNKTRRIFIITSMFLLATSCAAPQATSHAWALAGWLLRRQLYLLSLVFNSVSFNAAPQPNWKSQKLLCSSQLTCSLEQSVFSDERDQMNARTYSWQTDWLFRPMGRWACPSPRPML